MDARRGKDLILTEAFRNLGLQPVDKVGAIVSDKVLIGKVFNTRIFRRYRISEIVEKPWRLKAGVPVDKLEDNIYSSSHYTIGKKGIGSMKEDLGL